MPLRLWWRGRKNSAYCERWGERFAWYRRTSPLPILKQSIWIHAVSLGEAVAATPLIKALQRQYSRLSIVFTSMTPTGSAYIQKTFGNQITHCYVPYDYASAIKRFLDRFHPQILIILETELWPNILYQTAHRNIPIILANARLTERSFKSYRKIRFFIKKILSHITLISAQSQKDQAYFIELGAAAERVVVGGNIKFDFTIDNKSFEQAKKLRKLRHKIGINFYQQLITNNKQAFNTNIYDKLLNASIDNKLFNKFLTYVNSTNNTADSARWITAGSTHEGEEEIILAAYKEILTQCGQCRDIMLIIVPRHPERFDEVVKLCEEQGFITARFSALTRGKSLPSLKFDVVVGDVMGQLLLFYAMADVAIVGGSLVPVGGHNVIEPAALGVPVIVGPYTETLADIKGQLENAGGLITVYNYDELVDSIYDLLQNRSRRDRSGSAAENIIAQNQGVVENIVKEISNYLNKNYEF